MLAALHLNDVAAEKPNFLIFLADDLGYGDLSSYGHPTIRTPHLDRIADEGVRFTQWYSGSSVCSPARAALLTGRLPVRSGCAGRWPTGGVFHQKSLGGLPAEEVTIGEALRDHGGYRTHMIGKWHLGQRIGKLPTARGFETYWGIPYSCDNGGSAWAANILNFPPLPLLSNTTIVEQPVDLSSLTVRFSENAVAFIRARGLDTAAAAAADDGGRGNATRRPWFLYYSFAHVHTPNFCSPARCGTSARGRYGDATEEMDDAVGAAVDAVDSAGDANRTLILFTSDNGPWLKQRVQGGSAGLLRGGKFNMWEGGVRVPCVARWRGVIAPRTVSRARVASYDLLPTLLALGLGGSANASLATRPRGAFYDGVLDGIDLTLLLRGAVDDEGARVVDANNRTTDGGDEGGGDDDDGLPELGARCLFYYQGVATPGMGPGLWAARCGSYKAHFASLADDYSSNKGEPPCCVPGATPLCMREHDPPLVFHVDYDPSETSPLDPAGSEYAAARATIDKAVAAHEKSLTPVPNQMWAGGLLYLAGIRTGGDGDVAGLFDTSDPASDGVALCCDPDSQREGAHPEWPVCTCNAENWELDVYLGGDVDAYPEPPCWLCDGDRAVVLAAAALALVLGALVLPCVGGCACGARLAARCWRARRGARGGDGTLNVGDAPSAAAATAADTEPPAAAERRGDDAGASAATKGGSTAAASSGAGLFVFAEKEGGEEDAGVMGCLSSCTSLASTPRD